MKATITGSDVLSKRILLDLQSGLRVSEVPNHYPVSLDQAKRLSRFRRMIELAKENLKEEIYERLMQLGIKSLPLAPFFKKSDWAGLAEILSVVTEETTRDELQLLMNGLAEKRNRLIELKENADLLFSELEEMLKSLHSKENQLLRSKKEPGNTIDGLGDKKIDIELMEIREKKLAIEKELQKIRKNTVHSYMEMTETSDFLSTLNLKQYKELQKKALKWLFKRGFIAVADFTLPNGKRADIWAYNESQIVVFEVKSSKEDLMTDKKWTDLLPYCHDLYFLTPPELESLTAEAIKEMGCGQFVDTGVGLKMVKPDNRIVEKVDQQEHLKFAAGLALSRKVIYGY